MPDKPKKILIIQLRRIGDVVLTTPAAEVIKKNYPEAELDFLVEPPANEILEDNPDINQILVYEKNKPLKWITEIRKRNYDWVIDFLGNPRSELITALSKAKIKAGPANVFCKLGYNRLLSKITKPDYAATEKIKMLETLGIYFEDKKILPKIYLTSKDLENATKLLEKSKILPLKKNQQLIAFSPASRRITRQYPVKNWIKLARLLLANPNYRIVVFWGPGEKETADKITETIKSDRLMSAPQIDNLKTLASVLKRFDLLISNCNGTKHIATGVDIPTLTIYGASNPIVWTPKGYSQHHYIKNSGLQCVPCAKNTCPKDIICLKNLPAEIVYDKAICVIENIARSLR